MILFDFLNSKKLKTQYKPNGQKKKKLNCFLKVNVNLVEMKFES